MGGTTSKSTVDIANEIAIDASQKAIQDCISTTTQEQKLDFGSVVGDFNLKNVALKQKSSIDMKCVLEAKKQSEIQNSIATELAQKMASESRGMLQSFGGSESDATANIKSALALNVSKTDMQTALTSSMQKQAIEADYVGGNVNLENVSMDQTAEIVAEALVKSDAYSKVITELATKVDNDIKASKSGLDSEAADVVTGAVKELGGVINKGIETGGDIAMSGMLMVAVVVVIVAVIGLVVFMMIGPQNILRMLGLGGDSDDDYRDDEEEQLRNGKRKPREEEPDNAITGSHEHVARECSTCKCIIDAVTGACRPGCTCPCHSKTGGGCGCAAVVGGCCGSV